MRTWLIHHTMKKIRKWFYNNYKGIQKEVFKFTRKWTARNVYFHEHRAQVLDETTKSSGLSGRQPGFAGAFQTELSRLWKGAMVEEQQRCQALADRWSSEMPPEQVQAK